MRVTGKTRVVGVWGHPVSHSRSPAMQNAALDALGLDWIYVPFDVAPEALGAAVAGVRAMGIVGMNVTVPHKEAVLPFLDDVDPAAARIGSVNTIHNTDGRLRGYSTDGPGFMHSLRWAGEATDNRRVLILGAGGSARAVAHALAERGGRITVANRTTDRGRELVDDLNRHNPGAARLAEWGGEVVEEIDLVVNTTSLGMEPQAHTIPALPPGLLYPGVCVYDLVYAPAETRLLGQARAAGCKTLNGIPMLAAQGALSLSIWAGRGIDDIPFALMRSVAENPNR